MEIAVHGAGLHIKVNHARKHVSKKEGRASIIKNK